MTIEYIKGSDEKVDQDGWYLVLVTDNDHPNRITEHQVAEAARIAPGEEGIMWEQTGLDFDIWSYSVHSYTIEVICRLDLDKIAETARAQE